jgi:hypothetical protein
MRYTIVNGRYGVIWPSREPRPFFIYMIFPMPDKNGTGPLKMPGTIVTGGAVFLNTYL